MKKAIGLICIVLMFSVYSASAQLAFGVKGGVNISRVHFNKDVINPDNLTGFQIGPMIDFTVPLLGIGMDAAVLYSQKGIEYKSESVKTDYLEVPVNLKWKFGLPVFKGFLTAGPYASFRIGGDRIWDVPGRVNQQIEARNFGTGLNFGAGVEVIKHLQVGVNYDLGLTNAYRGSDLTGDGKNRGWAITAAILF